MELIHELLEIYYCQEVVIVKKKKKAGGRHGYWCQWGVDIILCNTVEKRHFNGVIVEERTGKREWAMWYWREKHSSIGNSRFGDYDQSCVELPGGLYRWGQVDEGGWHKWAQKGSRPWSSHHDSVVNESNWKPWGCRFDPWPCSVS